MPDKIEEQKFVSVDAEHENWLNRHWRPYMGWLYMATCAFDFIIAPILWAIIQAAMNKPITPWVPLTLQGAGLYHLSMGAILGVTAWSRGQEKMQAMTLNYSYPDNNIADRKKAAAARAASDTGDADRLIPKNA